MSARLILNADDFGLTTGINRSIEALHRAGVLTSATLMAGAPAFDDAIAIARRNPSLGVGCHVVLTDGVPVSPPDAIPSLVRPDGSGFRPSLLAFAIAVLGGRIRAADIRTEALAQIRTIQRAGVAVTHLDTHKHTHLFPAVSRPLLEAALASGVRAIRNPFEPAWNLALGHGTRLRRLQIGLLNTLQNRFLEAPELRSGSIATTSGTLGISATGNLDPAALRQILKHLPIQGTWELVCHPGYRDRDLDRVRTRLRAQREVEHAALLAVIPENVVPENVVPEILSDRDHPRLIHYGDLVTGVPRS